MAQQKIFSPLKLGLLIVTVSYFLFTLHALFTLQWFGEWNRITGSFNFGIFITDIAALPGLIFRFVGSLIALIAVIFYFSKGFPSTAKTYKILRWVLIFEGIYWLGLLATAIVEVQGVALMSLSNSPVTDILNSLVLYAIPSLVESIALPITLFILVFQLNPNKPMNKAIKWGLIAGAMYIFVFWLTNSSMWILTVQAKGTSYITTYPGNMLSFILTIFGLLALAIYTSIFAKQSSRAESLQELNLRTIGAIILSLGMYFLWNYLTWIWFNYPWSEQWDAWFLGHNMDLWMLSLPLLGLPLLFTNMLSKENNSK